MARRETLWQHLRWDLLALLLLGALFAAYSAVQSPRYQAQPSPTTEGSKPPDRTEGDLLLVLPDAPAAGATDFDNLDCSFGWINAVGHYFGTYASAPANSVTPQLLAGHSVAIVPGRVAAELSSVVREDLETFVRNGGLLIVETPRQGWDRITGMSTVGELEEATQITAIHGQTRPDVDASGDGDKADDTAAATANEQALGDPLFDVPLAGRVLPASGLDAQAGQASEVIFRVNDRPGLVVRPLEEGHVYSLNFDFACSLMAMYQGRPTQGLAFGPPDRPEWAPTSARVASERLVATAIPYADLLVKALFANLNRARPVARLWPFEGHSQGAAMSVHPAQQSPQAAFAYADWAGKQGARATLFGAPDHWSGHHQRLANELGADAGMLWVLGEQRPPITKGVGPGAFEPIARQLTLPEQRARFEATTGQAPQMVRTEGGLWQSDWATTFRTLAAAGMRVDTSFGPSAPGQYGYLFGTAMPFYPLDEAGLPLPILEMPFVLDGPEITRQRLRELMAASAAGYHQPLVLNLSAQAMATDPAAEILLGFREFHSLADEYDHWLTTVDEYLSFLRARRQAVLTSQWAPAEGRLTISVKLQGIRLQKPPAAGGNDSDDRDDGDIENSEGNGGEAPGDDSDTAVGAVPSVAVPTSYRGGAIDRVEVEDRRLDWRQLPTSGNGDEALIELPPGRHVISVFYEAPERGSGNSSDEP